jgi:Fic family protein
LDRRLERRDYCAILERTQKGDLEITDWLRWFLDSLDRAFAGAEDTFADVLRKARFREAMGRLPLNPRQRNVVKRLFDGFEAKLTSSKRATLTKTSPDRALRDINDLVARGVLVKDEAGGRSTSYSLSAWDGEDSQ